MRSGLRPFAIPLLGATLVAAPAAQAGTSTATLSARVQVQASCRVANLTLDFGQYRSGQSSPAVTQGQIELTQCAVGSVKIELDGGGSGKVLARKLRGPNGATLDYQLYKDSAKTKVFGRGSKGKTINLGSAASASVLVVGKIPAGQTAAPGTYTDTVHITVTF